MEVLLPVLCALLAGAALVWFVFAAPARSRAERAEARLEEIDRTTGSRFAALASDVLRSNSDSFLQLVSERFQSHRVEAEKDLQAREKAVEALVAPIRDELKKVEERAQQLEKSRVDAYRSVTEQVRQLAQAQSDLRSETGRLVQALRRPQGAGRWGEHQLRNVLEIAGMVEHVDFEEQPTLSGENGVLRPDVVVRLPGGKSVAVDAKTPLQAYLDAVEARHGGRARRSPRRAGGQRPLARTAAFGEEVLGRAGRGDGIRRHVHSRRCVPGRRAGARAGPLRGRRQEPGADRNPRSR